MDFMSCSKGDRFGIMAHFLHSPRRLVKFWGEGSGKNKKPGQTASP
jgi:hypothetical protein